MEEVIYLNLEVLKNSIIKIENSEYFPENTELWPSQYQSEENYYLRGTYNIFLSSKSKDYGYKVFLKHGYERYLPNELKSLDSIETLHNNALSERGVRTLHFFHKEMSKTKLTPDSFNIINFNKGLLFGTKMQKIQGRKGYGAELEECHKRRSSRGRRVKWHKVKCKYFWTLKKTMCDLHICPNQHDWDSSNFITSEQDGNPYLVDLDWRHINEEPPSTDKSYNRHSPDGDFAPLM